MTVVMTERNRLPRLLIVEDDFSQRTLLNDLLSEEGFDVVGVSTCEEALRQLQRGAFAVAIIDLRLPDAQGTDLLESIRNQCSSTRVIVHTAYGEFGSAKEALNLGAFAYVEKLGDPTELLRHVHRAVTEQAHVYAAEMEALVAERTKALRESEARLRSIVETAADGIVIVSETGSIEAINPAAELIFGYSADEITSQSVTTLLPSGDRKADAELLHAMVDETAAQASVRREAIGRRKDQSTFPMELSISGDRIGGRRRFTLIIRDATERKKADEALRESEARYRRIVETAEEGVWLVDANWKTLFVNAKIAKLLDRDASEIVGHGVEEFQSEDAQASTRAQHERLRQGKPVLTETTLLRADGRELAMLVSATPIFDEQGVYAGALGMLTDITERKRLEEDLRQSQKLEAIGRLAGGVAHDFNNLLTIINGYSGLIAEKLSAENPLRSLVDKIEEAGTRAASLTSQLLAFSRKQVLQPVILDLNLVLARMEHMLRRLIREDIELVSQPARNLAPVKADPGQMEQILLNLAVNARDAMPKGGRLTIATANVAAEEAPPPASPDEKPVAHVMISVRDSGLGMDEATRKRVFEPFFTTKAVGKGTGLGLAMVYGIVKQSGGNIEVSSEPGVGSLFRIYLPAISEPAATTEAATHPRHSPRGTETVLLVEDEESVRTLARRVLEQYGYCVLEARNGVEAMTVSQQYPAAIHLLLTDIVMPEMSGAELAHRLAKERPDTRILYMSGYADNALLRDDLQGRETKLVAKPFRGPTLALMVRECLDQ